MSPGGAAPGDLLAPMLPSTDRFELQTDRDTLMGFTSGRL